MVSDAAWSPSYDLRATTEDGKPSRTVSLNYRASIQQNTGEDWRNTVVTVSTAMPGSWSNIPALRAMKISPVFSAKSFKPGAGLFGVKPAPLMKRLTSTKREVTPAVFESAAPGGFASAPVECSQPPPATTALFGRQGDTIVPTSTGVTRTRGAADGWSEVDDEGEASDSPDIKGPSGTWSETKAVVTESAVSSSFRIEGNCTIPSESTAHKVAIAILTFSADVNYVTVPRSAPVTFLQVSSDFNVASFDVSSDSNGFAV